jgi:hypothetical protein
MPVITITFKGICTHLVATHEHGVGPLFDIRAGKRRIQHRVVLANSALIDSRIDPDRCVVPHVPKIRMGAFEEVLKDVAIGFDDVDLEQGDEGHHDTLKSLPHMWEKTGFPIYPRRNVLEGWTHYAAAYIDFAGGVEFEVVKDDTIARLHVRDSPKLLFRPCNTDKDVRVVPVTDEAIEISNLPERRSCSTSDYLLHYFVTTLDISNSAPVWALDPKLGDALDVKATAGRVAEVFCSSSTYP